MKKVLIAVLGLTLVGASGLFAQATTTDTAGSDTNAMSGSSKKHHKKHKSSSSSSTATNSSTSK
jgi:Spy/CpxP family protein refolding chaperone